MSGIKDNKVAMCCGCTGIGCIGVIIIMLVGGYFGVNFVAGKGRDFAAYALEKGMEMSLKDAFSEQEKEEIMSKTSKLAKDIKEGKIGLIDLAKNVSSQISDSTLFAQTIALSFKRNYLMVAENSDENSQQIIAEKEDDKLISKFIYGLTNNKITHQQAKKFLQIVTIQYKEKFDPESENNMTYTGKKMNNSLSTDQVKNALECIKEIGGNIKIPQDFNPSETTKNEYLKILASVYEKESSK